MKIRVAEIFESISGEIGMFPQGSPTTFIRLAGCNLRCPWCDTKWANGMDSGILMDLDEVTDSVDSLQWDQVLITGGEPLIQRKQLLKLIYRLKAKGYEIQVETNGSLRIDDMYADCWVVDCKGKDSMEGMPYQFDPGILDDKVWVKYLVGSSHDLNAAINMAKVFLRNGKKSRFAVSPIEGKVSYSECMTLIQESKLPILLNVQIHKKMGDGVK